MVITMIPMTTAQIRDAVAGVLHGDEALTVTGVSTDSRQISPGDWFVPILGERFDGHDYIDKADAVTTTDETDGFVCDTAVTIKNGVVTADSKSFNLADDYTIYVIDDDGGVTTMTAENVEGLDNIAIVTLVGNVSDDEITEVYEIYIVLNA